MICSYCNKGAKLVQGDEIYPGRAKTANNYFWECLPCGAYIACHPFTKTARGTLANFQTRAARQVAHKVFDPFWICYKWTRTDAYLALARVLKIPLKQCHIAEFNEEQCKKVVRICENSAHLLAA